MFLFTIRQKKKGGIYEGYLMQEAIILYKEYMKNFSNVNQYGWDDDDD